MLVEWLPMSVLDTAESGTALSGKGRGNDDKIGVAFVDHSMNFGCNGTAQERIQLLEERRCIQDACCLCHTRSCLHWREHTRFRADCANRSRKTELLSIQYDLRMPSATGKGACGVKRSRKIISQNAQWHLEA